MIRESFLRDSKFLFFNFLLAYLFFGITSLPDLIAYVCLSFVLLLFVPLLKQDFIGSEFIQKNKIFLIGISSFLLINHINFLHFYIGAFVTLGLITSYTIMIICLFTLYMKKNDITNEDQDISTVEKSLD